MWNLSYAFRIVLTDAARKGGHVIVWGTPEHGTDEPVGFTFPTKGENADVGLAGRASRLVAGTEAVIEYMIVTDEWNVAQGLSAS